MKSNLKLLTPIGPSKKKLIKHLDLIIKKNSYSNFGYFHEKLISELSKKLEVDPNRIMLTSNGYSAIESAFLFFEYFFQNKSSTVPSWMFPAAINLASKYKKKIFVNDVNEEGFLKDLNYSSINIIQSPFGYIPKNYLNKQYIKSSKIYDFAAALPNFIHKKIKIDLDDNEFLTFSMHATKLISSCEGGVVIAKDKRIINEIKKMINFGFNNKRNLIYQKGLNAKLSELNCLFGYESLISFSKNLNKYLDIKEKFRNDLQKYGVIFFKEYPNISLTENILVKNTKDSNKLIRHNFRRWWNCIDNSKLNSFNLWQKVIGVPFNAEKNIAKQIIKFL